MRTTIFLLLLLLAGAAYADVVVVGKREIRGEIQEETADYVKIKVGEGVLTIPKKQIKEIRREDEVDTLVGEARTLTKTLDAKALGLFDRAIAAARKKGDTARADSLQKERNDFATKVEKDTSRQAGRASAPELTGDGKASADDIFLLEADLEEVRVHVNGFKEGDKNAGRRGAARLIELSNKHAADGQWRWCVGCLKLARSIDPQDAKQLWASERQARFRACGQAVRERDARIAKAAIEPLVADDPKDPHVAYLEGRAREVATALTAARDAFRRALDGVAVPNVADLPVDWLRELARMRAAGVALGAGSAGFGDQWRRTESAHFVVYHELGDDFNDAEPKAFEDARAAALLRLGFSDADVSAGNKIPMFLFKDRDNYMKGGGPDWAAGHVGHLALEDGDARTIYAYPGRRLDTSTMQHELAHVLVSEACPKLTLASWATEGVACFAEPDATRTRRHQDLGRAIAAGTFVPLKEFLGRATVPADEGRDAIGVFYAESAVVFAAIQAKAGSVKDALEIAARIARKGHEVGLRELGTDAVALEAEIKAEFEKK